MLKKIGLVILATLHISISWCEERDMVVYVFHTEWGRPDLNQRVQYYIQSVEHLGYKTLRVRSDKTDIFSLKRMIEKELKAHNKSFKNILGINIFGDIISTDRALYKHPRDNQYTFAPLMFPELDFVTRKNTIVNVKDFNKSLLAKFWVAHIHKSTNNTDLNTDHLATKSEYKETVGYNFLLCMNYCLNQARSVSYYSTDVYALGKGTSIIGMCAMPVLYLIAGLGRLSEGYSFWNRYQTDGDMIGTTFLYTAFTTIFTYCLWNYLKTPVYKSNDARWQRLVFQYIDGQDGITALIKKALRG